MKKRLALLLALTLMAAAVLSGCGSKEKEADNKEKEYAEKKSGDTFTVGFDQDFPPMGFVGDDGEYTGFDLELAAEVCKRLELEFVPKPIAWDAKDAELGSGGIDCIWNGFTMNGREDAYTWTVPYVDNSQVFVVAEESGIAVFEDMAGKAVGVQRDSSALSALNDEESPENIRLRDSFGSLTEYADYNTAFMDLEAGALDAVAMDIGVAQYQIDSRNGGYVILQDYLASEEYGVGFLLGNTELRDTVEASLKEMLADGTFAAIAEEWGLSEAVCLGEK